MKTIQQILISLEKAEKEQLKISLDDTLKIVQACKPISKDPQIIDKLIYLINVLCHKDKHIKKLSERESQILKHIGLGFTSKEIGIILSITEATVSTHRKNIIKKLKISGVGQLQNFAFQWVQSTQ